MPRKSNASPQTRRVFAAFLSQPQDWRYGYELLKELGLKSGTLYPLLIRLSDQGLLESKWFPSQEIGRPPRNAYRLTAKGVALARSQAMETATGLGVPLGVPA
jgi:DNA-binding PadR family transcriptional regulator